MILVKGDIIHFEFPDYVPTQWVIKGPHFAVILFDSIDKSLNTVTVVPITSSVDHETGVKKALKSWHMELDHNKYKLKNPSYLKTDQIQSIDRDKIRLCDEKIPLTPDDLSELDIKLIEVFEMFQAFEFYSKKKYEMIYESFIKSNNEKLFNDLRSSIDSDVFQPMQDNLNQFISTLSIDDQAKNEIILHLDNQKTIVCTNMFGVAKKFVKKQFK